MTLDEKGKEGITFSLEGRIDPKIVASFVT